MTYYKYSMNEEAAEEDDDESNGQNEENLDSEEADLDWNEEAWAQALAGENPLYPVEEEWEVAAVLVRSPC